MDGLIIWKDKAKQKLSHLFSFRSLSFDRSQARSHCKKGKSLSSADSSIRSSPSISTSHNDTSNEKSLDNNGSGADTKCNKKGTVSDNEDSNVSTTDQLNVKKSMPYLTGDSSLITLNLYKFLLSSLPNIVKGCQWTLLYSTVKHGISLRTLIRRSYDLSGPCLLGTIQTFVFTTLYGEPRLFRPTGANRYFYMCMNDLLAFGGGNFALCLDEDLLSGTSGPCATFGNECLAHGSEFEVKNVELWGFTHSSRYFN